MIKESIPAGKQGSKKGSHYNFFFDVFNSLGKVYIIKVTELEIKYIIEYQDETLEFPHTDLLNEKIFNTKCLKLGLSIIPRRKWYFFMNVAIARSIKNDVRDYPPNVEAAKKFCRYLLGKLDIGDSLTGDLYSHPAQTKYHNDIDGKLVGRILERNNIRLSQENRQVNNKMLSIWKLDLVKLKEFCEWKGN